MNLINDRRSMSGFMQCDNRVGGSTPGRLGADGSSHTSLLAGKAESNSADGRPFNDCGGVESRHAIRSNIDRLSKDQRATSGQLKPIVLAGVASGPQSPFPVLAITLAVPAALVFTTFVYWCFIA